jgi:hypothetical protein
MTIQKVLEEVFEVSEVKPLSRTVKLQVNSA